MRELLFLNPVVRPGLNLTVRNGTKWDDKSYPGKSLDIKPTLDAHGKPTTGKLGHAVAIGHVLSTQVVNMDQMEPQVLAKVLRHEHDPACMREEGLVIAMDRAYPQGWGPYVTLLWFWVS